LRPMYICTQYKCWIDGQNTQQSAKYEEGICRYSLAHCSLSILLVYLVLKLFQPQTLPATQQ
jgi:hypothetical protein